MASAHASPLLYSSTAPISSFACPAPISSDQCNGAKAYLNGLSGPAPRELKQDIFFRVLDYQLNGNNHISAEYLFQNYTLPNGYNTATTANASSASTNGRADFHQRYFISNWESVITPSMTNAFRFQWGRDLEVTSANAPGPSTTSSLAFRATACRMLCLASPSRTSIAGRYPIPSRSSSAITI